MYQSPVLLGMVWTACCGITFRSAAWIQTKTIRRRSSRLAARLFDAETIKIVDDHDTKFIRPLEKTVSDILTQYDPGLDILSLPPGQRQCVGVARHLSQRLEAFRVAGDCPRCWLQRAHCVCTTVRPIPHCPVRRIFVLVHHKEICLQVDTAKFILAAFPDAARLVVAGIGAEYQPAMQELVEAISRPESSLVLFPSDESVTWTEHQECHSSTDVSDMDLVILDGTWEQARKMHKRYIPADTPRVHLREEVLLDQSGRQLRRHPERWREISTLAAARFLLEELDPSKQWSVIGGYQCAGDAAARKQLGAKRPRQKPSA